MAQRKFSRIMFAFPLVKYPTMVQFLDDKAIDSLIYLCHGNESLYRASK